MVLFTSCRSRIRSRRSQLRRRAATRNAPRCCRPERRQAWPLVLAFGPSSPGGATGLATCTTPAPTERSSQRSWSAAVRPGGTCGHQRRRLSSWRALSLSASQRRRWSWSLCVSGMRPTSRCTAGRERSMPPARGAATTCEARTTRRRTRGSAAPTARSNASPPGGAQAWLLRLLRTWTLTALGGSRHSQRMWTGHTERPAAAPFWELEQVSSLWLLSRPCRLHLRGGVAHRSLRIQAHRRVDKHECADVDDLEELLVGV